MTLDPVLSLSVNNIAASLCQASWTTSTYSTTEADTTTPQIALDGYIQVDLSTYVVSIINPMTSSALAKNDLWVSSTSAPFTYTYRWHFELSDAWGS